MCYHNITTDTQEVLVRIINSAQGFCLAILFLYYLQLETYPLKSIASLRPRSIQRRDYLFKLQEELRKKNQGSTALNEEIKRQGGRSVQNTEERSRNRGNQAQEPSPM